MKTAEGMQEAAVDVVTKLLAGRLERAGMPTGEPERHFQCEAEPARENQGGFEVRVRTWRHWSNAHVYIDADTGQVIGYSIPRYARPATDAEMSRDDAIAAASAVVDVPPDAELQSFYHVQYRPRTKAARLEWQHVHQGMRVDGDSFWVVVHPETRRVIEYFRKWREVSI